MRLKLYRAPTMAEAMARVQAELGPDALILATRHVAEGVEITAALEPEPPPAAPDPGRERLLAYHDIPADLCPVLGRGSLDAALAAALSFAPLPLGGECPRSCSPARPAPARR